MNRKFVVFGYFGVGIGAGHIISVLGSSHGHEDTYNLKSRYNGRARKSLLLSTVLEDNS